MSLAITQLEMSNPGRAEVDAFLAGREFPLVEGPHATFVWRGEAERVNLRHFIFGLPSEMPFRRIGGTDLWYCTVDLPAESRVEYKIDVVRNGHGEWIQDPLNPRLANDPFGANSVCQAAGYQTPEWVYPSEEARPGRLQDIHFGHTAFGNPRGVTLYYPARYRDSRRYPLLMVHDGGDYLKYSNLKPILDNLIHRLEVQPLIVALTHPRERTREYADDPAHTAFLCDELLPRLERELPLFGTPASRCLMGASFGAVASLAAAWRRPGVFSGLILQSGSFAFTDIGEHSRGSVFDPVVRFVNAFRESPGKPAERAFVSCGVYESLIYENRSMVPFLQGLGMEVRYVEARDGHNWENWRDRMRMALSWMFPGHLWMVYE